MSRIAGLVSIGYAVWAFVLTNGISSEDKTLDQMVVAGGCFITLLFAFHEGVDSLRNHFSNLIANVTSEIKTHDSSVGTQIKDLQEAAPAIEKLSTDDWLAAIFDKLVKICEYKHDNHHATVYHRRDIVKRIDLRLNQLNNAIITYPKDREHDRMTRLQESLEIAKQYYYAVTLLDEEYVDNFWHSAFTTNYMQLHQQKRSNVDIRRIFVFVSGVSERITEIMAEAISHHEKFEIVTKIIRNPDSSHPLHTKTSFFVCDDKVCSESYGLVGRKIDGYWGFDLQRVEYLKDKFDGMLEIEDVSHLVLNGGRGK